MVERCLEAECTLLELSLLLVTHGHIVKELKGYVLVATTGSQVDCIEDSMSFLEKKQRIFKLFPVEVR